MASNGCARRNPSGTVADGVSKGETPFEARVQEGALKKYVDRS
jgi:hypothetical protein